MWVVLVTLWAVLMTPLDVRVAEAGLDTGWEELPWYSARPPEMEHHTTRWYVRSDEDFTLAGRTPTRVSYGYAEDGLAGVMVVFDAADCDAVGDSLYETFGQRHAEHSIRGVEGHETLLATWDATAINIRWAPWLAGECLISYRVPVRTGISPSG